MMDATLGPLFVVFAAVARLGSFSLAASTLNLSKSVVSDRIKLLEDRCGVRLLERTTRRVRLTAAGADVLDTATSIEDSLGILSRKLDAGRDETSRQAVFAFRIPTISVPCSWARRSRDSLRLTPKVHVDILSEDAAHDLLEARIDVAVRLGQPEILEPREPKTGRPPRANRGSSRPRR